MNWSKKPGKHRIFRCRKNRKDWSAFHPKADLIASGVMILCEVPLGFEVCITSFSPRITREQQTYLQAYGITPGRPVRVIQQSPVTILQVDHLEIAMEHNLSREICVGRFDPSRDV